MEDKCVLGRIPAPSQFETETFKFFVLKMFSDLIQLVETSTPSD